MKKKNLILMVEKTIAVIAKNAASIEANTACPLWGYQAKESKDIKKLRKF